VELTRRQAIRTGLLGAAGIAGAGSLAAFIMFARQFMAGAGTGALRG
jgi:hypothetical protein